MNISSIVVKTKTENTAQVIKTLENSDLCEYHMHDKYGRIIVTIEGQDVGEEIGKLRKIEKTESVISADMVYSYSEDELDKIREDLDNNDKLPNWLNDENAKVEDIKYNGDLKGML